MRIDEVIPVADVTSSHSIVIAAPPTAVRRALLEINLSDDALVRVLLRLRGLPRRATTWTGLQELGFIQLANAPDAFIVGLAGRFWTPRGGLVRLSPEEFSVYAEPGSARTAWSFEMEPTGAGTELTTETRVQCTDDASRRHFRRYWRIVGPFSGIIRRRVLRLVERGTLE